MAIKKYLYPNRYHHLQYFSLETPLILILGTPLP